jgi:acetyl esterase
MQKVDVWPLLSPESQAVSRKSRELYAGVGELPAHPVAAARAAYLVERRHWNGFPAPVAKVEDFAADSGHGQVKLRLYHPEPAERRPLLIFLHGGGYILGNLDTHDRVQRLLANESGWAVLGVDYALAPEAKFPTQILQIAGIVERLETVLAGRNVATEKGYALAGDSAGANLSMGTTFELRSRGRALPRGLLLYYGGFGLKDGPSRRLYGGELDGLGERELDMYYGAYRRSPEDAIDPRNDILRGDLAGLPPVHLVACRLDPLCDDSVALAEALRVVGVPAALSIYDEVLHGFLHYSAVEPRAMQAIREGAAFLRGLAQASEMESPRFG